MGNAKDKRNEREKIEIKERKIEDRKGEGRGNQFFLSF